MNLQIFKYSCINRVESMPFDERYDSIYKRNSLGKSGKIKQLSSTESTNIGDLIIYLYMCIYLDVDIVVN